MILVRFWFARWRSGRYLTQLLHYRSLTMLDARTMCVVPQKRIITVEEVRNRLLDDSWEENEQHGALDSRESVILMTMTIMKSHNYDLWSGFLFHQLTLMTVPSSQQLVPPVYEHNECAWQSCWWWCSSWWEWYVFKIKKRHFNSLPATRFMYSYHSFFPICRLIKQWSSSDTQWTKKLAVHLIQVLPYQKTGGNTTNTSCLSNMMLSYIAVYY